MRLPVQDVYPRLANYEGWVSLFGTYVQLETEIAKEKTSYGDEILIYFRQLLPLDELHAH